MPEKIDVNELGRSVDPKSLSEEELVAALRDGLADGGAEDIDPSLFARLVKSTGKGQLEAVMSSEVRRPVLDAIFGRMAEFYSSKGSSAKRQVVHWHVTGAPGGGDDSYQTAMQHGTCEVSEELVRGAAHRAARWTACSSSRSSRTTRSPITLFMTRKLKVSGDVGFATALQKMFTIPSA